MEAAAAAVNKMQRLDDLIAKLQAKVRLSFILCHDFLIIWVNPYIYIRVKMRRHWTS